MSIIIWEIDEDYLFVFWWFFGDLEVLEYFDYYWKYVMGFYIDFVY